MKGGNALRISRKSQRCDTITQNYFYRGSDKALARPGRKQATATEL